MNLRTLAEQILAGDFSGLPNLQGRGYWKEVQWKSEAQYLLDTGDGAELEYMIAKDLANDAFQNTNLEAWQFEDWFDANKTRFTAMVGKE